MVNEYLWAEIEDQKLRKILQSVAETGKPAVLRGAAKMHNARDFWIGKLNEVEFLSHDRRQFGYAKDFYKDDWWEIANTVAKENSYAWSKTPQPLHTDNAWFGDPAEINFFIMEKQVAIGGEQTLYVLEDLLSDLKLENPALLDRLLNTTVTIKKGDEDDVYNKTPIIKLDPTPRIFWNYYRTIRENAEIENLIEDFFDFLKVKVEFDKVAKIKLESGDCLIMNDMKNLHGRTGFEATYDRERILLQSMWQYTPS